MIKTRNYYLLEISQLLYIDWISVWLGSVSCLSEINISLLCGVKSIPEYIFLTISTWLLKRKTSYLPIVPSYTTASLVHHFKSCNFITILHIIFYPKTKRKKLWNMIVTLFFVTSTSAAVDGKDFVTYYFYPIRYYFLSNKYQSQYLKKIIFESKAILRKFKNITCSMLIM